MIDIPTPALRHSFTLKVELSKPIELGQGRAGTRRIIPIVGGKALGPDINGEILNVGADWQTIFVDGNTKMLRASNDVTSYRHLIFSSSLFLRFIISSFLMPTKGTRSWSAVGITK